MIDNFSTSRKVQGQSLWLTRLYTDLTTLKNQRQRVLLHEFCRFVSPEEGFPGLFTDIYIRDQQFILGKVQRLHNCDTLALFFLEWCVGHANVSSLPKLVNPAHFSKFPRVNGATGEIEVGN